MENKNAELDISERTKYYEAKLEDYLKSYSLEFEKFVGNPEAIKVGDSLLANGLSSGYNFAHFGEFPIGKKEQLITYSIYAQRTNHLAQAVSEIEQKIEGFTEENVSFGIRASKIRGDYGDKEPFRRQIKMKDGSIETTMESVDCVLIFSPSSIMQASKIIDYLADRAPDIEGGYEDPDLRVNATKEFEEVFVSSGVLKLGIANLFKFGNGNVIALRQKTKLQEKDWDFDNLLHPKLFEYLVISDKGVKVEP